MMITIIIPEIPHIFLNHSLLFPFIYGNILPKEGGGNMRTQTKNEVRKKIFFALGTVNSLTYSQEYDEAAEEAIERVKELHNKLSAFDENSDIGRINKNAGIAPVEVSSEAMYLISSSIMYSELTGGQFDITTRPLSSIWKASIKTGFEPLKYEIEKAVGLISYKDIILDRRQKNVMLRKTGQEIDLGGIAKGFAADEVRRIFEKHGADDVIINLGGTVIVIGEKQIGLQDPFQKTGVTFGKLPLCSRAAVTSGTYEQSAVIGEKTVHHIIDPKTGYPAKTELRSVTLIGENAEELDALSTAVLIKGIANSMDILRAGNIEAVFVTNDGMIYATEGLRDGLSLNN